MKTQTQHQGDLLCVKKPLDIKAIRKFFGGALNSPSSIWYKDNYGWCTNKRVACIEQYAPPLDNFLPWQHHAEDSIEKSLDINRVGKLPLYLSQASKVVSRTVIHKYQGNKTIVKMTGENGKVAYFAGCYAQYIDYITGSETMGFSQDKDFYAMPLRYFEEEENNDQANPVV